jgi:hypothetical protein
MAKFNTPAAGNTTKTVNKAGGEAYQESPKLEFVSLLLTSFVQDQYYRKESEQITRVKGSQLRRSSLRAMSLVCAPSLMLGPVN